MSHRRRGGSTGHAEKSQSSPEILDEGSYWQHRRIWFIKNVSRSNGQRWFRISYKFHTSQQHWARQTPVRRSQGRKTSNEEKIKKLAFRLDRIKNKKIRFLLHKEFLEKCFRDKLTPNGLKINLELTIGNQNEEFVNQWYKIQDDCANKLMKMTIKFCETAIKETEHIKKIDSKLQSNLPSTVISKNK